METNASTPTVTSTYQKRPISDVTTQDLIATVQADRDDSATFEARAALTKRCGPGTWQAYAPVRPRSQVNLPDGGILYWHNFVEEGWL